MIQAIRHEELNSEDDPCETLEDYSYQNCYLNKMIMDIGCQPYWIEEVNTKMRNCSKSSDIKQFLEKMIYISTTDELKLQKEFNCIKPCRYMEYKVVEEPQNFFRADLNPNATHIWLTMASPKITVEKEVESYSVTTFVADWGGLLGLFVGFNFLMIWDCFVCIYENKNKFIWLSVVVIIELFTGLSLS